MKYTVKQVAKLSGISVRTLHWYDAIHLLSPAFVGENGYRYYQDEQLLLLQQILFYKELGFALEKIRLILHRSDFDKMSALISHKKLLQEKIQKDQRLVETIDQTIKHLKGDIHMQREELFKGFDKAKQEQYEQEIEKKFGQASRAHIEESKQKMRQRTPAEHQEVQKEFHRICFELKEAIIAEKSPSSDHVQELIRGHYLWIQNFWTPSKESYLGHAQFILDSDLRKTYEKVHPKLPTFLKEGIEQFASRELS